MVEEDALYVEEETACVVEDTEHVEAGTHLVETHLAEILSVEILSVVNPSVEILSVETLSVETLAVQTIETNPVDLRSTISRNDRKNLASFKQSNIYIYILSTLQSRFQDEQEISLSLLSLLSLFAFEELKLSNEICVWIDPPRRTKEGWFDDR